MKFIRNRKELEHSLILMHHEGRPIRELSRQFQLGRNTVRRILRAHAQRRDSGHEALIPLRAGLKRVSKLDGFAPEIKKLLDKYPKITGLRIYEELKEMGYPGGISILRERLKQLRAPDREPVIRFETEPGRQGQMDWSPYTIPFTRSGKSQVQCFSYILGFSRRQYIDFTIRHDFYSLIRRHQDAFQYFGGVPRECLYDNEKTVVLRWECGRPLFNPAFTAFITHYQCKPIACRQGRPETKGKIEAPFQYVEGNLLNGRDFQDLDDLRARARWWLKEKSDLHIHDTTRHAPLELFSQETLQPLPRHPYDSSEVALRVCGPDGFIEFETNHYSVPSENIADILSLKATENEIRIYSPEIELIAHHQRHRAGLGKKVENPDHFKTQKIRYGLEPVREAFLELGEMAEEFLKGLTERHPRNCGFHARHILRMKEYYQSEDIHRAIQHAICYQAFEARAIERILRAQATPRTLESIRNERARRELQRALPKITQRPLVQYSELLREDNDHVGGDLDPNQASSGDPQTSGNTDGP
jgi:transposase